MTDYRLGTKVELFTTKELARVFVYFSSIKDVSLDSLLLEMYAELVSRGEDPTNLTHLDEDNDSITCEVDNLQGTAILAIPQEFKIGEGV